MNEPCNDYGLLQTLSHSSLCALIALTVRISITSESLPWVWIGLNNVQLESTVMYSDFGVVFGLAQLAASSVIAERSVILLNVFSGLDVVGFHI